MVRTSLACSGFTLPPWLSMVCWTCGREVLLGFDCWYFRRFSYHSACWSSRTTNDFPSPWSLFSPLTGSPWCYWTSFLCTHSLSMARVFSFCTCSFCSVRFGLRCWRRCWILSNCRSFMKLTGGFATLCCLFRAVWVIYFFTGPNASFGSLWRLCGTWSTRKMAGRRMKVVFCW